MMPPPSPSPPSPLAPARLGESYIAALVAAELLLFLVLSAIFYIQQRWVGHLRTPDVEEDRHIWSGTVCSTTRRGNLLFGAFRGACLIAVSGVALYDWTQGTTWPAAAAPTGE